MTDTLSTLAALAAELKLPRNWIRREALAGRLPCLRVGRRILFNAAAVKAALATRAAESREGASCES